MSSPQLTGRPGALEAGVMIGASLLVATGMILIGVAAGEPWTALVITWMLMGLGYNLGMLHARFIFARRIERESIR